MGMKRFTSKMLFLRAAYAATYYRNEKKPGKPGCFDLSLCSGRRRAPLGALALGLSRRPFESRFGAVDPFAQRNKHQTAQPPSASLAQGDGVPLGSQGGRRHLAAGAKGPGLPNGKPGPGAKGPRPGFQGATRPRRPPRAAGILPTPTGQGRPMECNLNQAGSNAPAIEQVGIHHRHQSGNGNGWV